MHIWTFPLQLMLYLSMSLGIGFGCSGGQHNNNTLHSSMSKAFANSTALPQSNSTNSHKINRLDDELTQLQTDIKNLIGNAQCHTALDCRSIALGHKACGGPTVYLPYSVLITSPTSLIDKVNRYNELVDKSNKLEGYFSTCNFLTPAPVGCINQQCQEVTLPCYNANCNNPSPSATSDKSTEILKQEVNQLIGKATCSSSDQCGTWILLYLAQGCKASETFAFSTLNTQDEALLAQTLEQYGAKTANAMHTFDKHFTSYLDYSMGSCQAKRCVAAPAQILTCKP